MYVKIENMTRLMSHLLFIYLAFWSLQSLNMEHLFKKGQSNRQMRFVYFFLAVALGYLASCFFLEFLGLSRNLVT